MTRADYANDVLRLLGVAHPIMYVGARRGLVAVMLAESGVAPCDGNWGADYNPLNTTLYMPGATDFNSSHVRNYLDWADGTNAVAATLIRGPYADLVKVLTNPLATAQHVIDAWDLTPWGTHKPLLTEALASYRLDRTMYNRLSVG